MDSEPECIHLSDTSLSLDGFDDLFIDRLFEMVEITRDTDEVLNYAIIRLIVSPARLFLPSIVVGLRSCFTGCPE